MLNFRSLVAIEKKRRQQAASKEENDSQINFVVSTPSDSPHLSNFLVIPNEVLYIPEYITRHEESQLLQLIDSAAQGRWVQGEKRKVCNFGGLPGRSERTEPLPPFLQTLLDSMVTRGIFTDETVPNHVLVNEYSKDGGIVPHVDGPMYFNRVAVLTLSGSALLEFSEVSTGQETVSVLLQPRSLHIVGGELYSTWNHSIAGRVEDIVPETCVNIQLANVVVGEKVLRAERRISVVCVRKLAFS